MTIHNNKIVLWVLVKIKPGPINISVNKFILGVLIAIMSVPQAMAAIDVEDKQYPANCQSSQPTADSTTSTDTTIFNNLPLLPDAHPIDIMQEMKGYRCLAFDGGGVRGAYSIGVLVKLEQMLKEQNLLDSQNRTALANMFAAGLTGTSTGSIIALGISCTEHFNAATNQFEDGPYTPLEILKLYQEISQEVFVSWSMGNFIRNIRSKGWFKKLLTCFGCCAINRNCMGLFGPKYDNKTLKEKLEFYFKDMLLENTIVPVQVITYDLNTRMPMFLTSVDHPHMKMVDAILASSAAPTYFPVAHVDDGFGNKLRCIDGGIIENAPCISAKCFGEENIREKSVDANVDNLLMLHIGTGEEVAESMGNEFDEASILTWGMNLVPVIMGGNAQHSIKQTDRMMNQPENKHYFRIQTILHAKDASMDDPKNVNILASRGRNEHHTKSILDDFCHAIKKRKPLENS